MKTKTNKKEITLKQKQKEAISSLKCNLDELDNKPRRLFKSLREFTDAFNDNRPEIIDSIIEAEKLYYFYLSIPDIVKDMLGINDQIKRELLSTENTKRIKEIYKEKGEYYMYGYQNGIEEALKKQSIKTAEHLLELYS